MLADLAVNDAAAFAALVAAAKAALPRLSRAERDRRLTHRHDAPAAARWATVLTQPRSPRVVGRLRRLAGAPARHRDESGRFLAEGPQAVREALGAAGRRRGRGSPVVHELYGHRGRSPPAAERARDGPAAGLRPCTSPTEALAALSRDGHPAGRGRGLPPRRLTALGAVAGRRARAGGGAGRRRATPATRARCCAPPTPPAPARSCSPTGASTRTTPSACGPAPGSCSTCRSCAGVPVAAAVAALRGAGLRGAGGRRRRRRGPRRPGRRRPAAGPLAAPVAWLFGNEAGGCRTSSLAAADAGSGCPIHGRAESLNLAAAAAVCLYASARERTASTRLMLMTSHRAPRVVLWLDRVD